ncbi:MAG: branched-chain amino acid ABC transporter substrate-binding protein [Deltaproteobacteria bacterium]|nr:branched-chain amino acid ABC transporter substrate-binding protein [Deltaproteobacteria bacterium]
MKVSRMSHRHVMVFAVALFFLLACGLGGSTANAFQPLKGDMSTFIPGKSDVPVTGDTIKLGVINPFSGPGAISGELYYLAAAWVAHDINSQGGILVDGKMKKIQILKGDTQTKPDIAKKAIEKLVLQDNVDVLVGTSGTHITLVAQMMARVHKKIFMNNTAFSDLLLDKENWNPYVFQVMAPNTTQWTLALAQYFKNRPEKKFYILCQDYAYGHAYAETFKAAIKKYKPEAQIVGEDFFPLFTKDFAPYITKVKAAGAEFIITQAWAADNENLTKQSRQLGLKIPISSLYVDDTRGLRAIGGPAGAGFVLEQSYIPTINTPANKKFVELWHKQWGKWSAPYDTDFYKWPAGFVGSGVVSLYCLFDVIQKAGTTNPDKIIKTWEGLEQQSIIGPMYMRPQDHLMLGDIFFSELVFPNKWFEHNAGWGRTITIPRALSTPPVINGR